MLQSKVFIRPRPRLNPKVRLFCFPFAGGGVNTYMPWVELMHCDVELVLVQLPGRGSRMLESAHDDMESVINELMQEADFITKIPYIFFGHSLGSRVAFELACTLQSHNMPLPQYFIASGSRPPHLDVEEKEIYKLPEPEFLQELKELNGTPQEILANEELMQILIPLLRADFKIADTYRATKTAMPFPMLVLHGKEDIEITLSQLFKWSELSNVNCNLVEINGDHFFIHEYSHDVVEQVSSVVKLVLKHN